MRVSGIYPVAAGATVLVLLCGLLDSAASEESARTTCKNSFNLRSPRMSVYMFADKTLRCLAEGQINP